MEFKKPETFEDILKLQKHLDESIHSSRERTEEDIKLSLIAECIEFENKETEYTQNIMLSALKSLFCTVSFKKFHKEYNKIKDLDPKFQEIIDVSAVYFDFFERDIQDLGFVK